MTYVCKIFGRVAASVGRVLDGRNEEALLIIYYHGYGGLGNDDKLTFSK